MSCGPPVDAIIHVLFLRPMSIVALMVWQVVGPPIIQSSLKIDVHMLTATLRTIQSVCSLALVVQTIGSCSAHERLFLFTSLYV